LTVVFAATCETSRVSEHPVDSASPYYQHQRYWNSLPRVIEHINRRTSGDPSVDWKKDVRNRRGVPFERALVLNCGSGWVERELVEIGAVKSVIATDISESLVDFARSKANEQQLPIEYVVRDANAEPLPLDGVDLVINHAACHHLARLDRVLGSIADALPDDGWFVSFDYVGAHRNQYPAEQWEAAVFLNDELPAHLQSKMSYPHLKTMLASDPSEAIHSELFLEVHDRYFAPVENRPIGGWLAYLILTGNDGLFDHLGPEADHWVERVLAADQAAVHANPAHTLFSYVIGQPRRPSPSAEQRAAWAEEEAQREEMASRNGGTYYPNTVIARALHEADPNGVGQLRPEQLVQTLPGRLLAEHLLRRIQPIRRAKDLARAARSRLR
jgi:SAM-dependent methyltransferase